MMSRCCLCALFVLLCLSGCSQRVTIDPTESLKPLDLKADVSVSIGSISNPKFSGMARISVKFWRGEAKESFRNSVTLAKGDALWVNGQELELTQADWGPFYTIDPIKAVSDGLYVFRFSIGGQTFEKEVRIQPTKILSPKAEQDVSSGKPIEVTWSPPFPSVEGSRSGLSSCVVATAKKRTTSSVEMDVRLSGLEGKCRSMLHVGFSGSRPIGAPFAGGKLSTSSAAAFRVNVTR